MEVFSRITALREKLASHRRAGQAIGFVPTMGYLHAGHGSLVEIARTENEVVVASIFVNPKQFGPNEDLSRYPRDLDRDKAMLESLGTDYLFFPEVDEVYPDGYATTVSVKALTNELCGASRPGHFDGVTTVVCKLFNMVQPDRAYFGMKDYQQYRVIERMARDLNFPIEIVPLPTVREADGLAMSSRNAYLSPEDRKEALALSRSLAEAQRLVAGGEQDAARLLERLRNQFYNKGNVILDYLELVDAHTLQPIEKIAGECLLAVAARVGRTRLIDNIVLLPGTPTNKE